MSDKKRFKPTQTPIIVSILILLIAILTLVSISVINITLPKTNNMTTKSYILGEATIKGYVGVELKYDIKPESIALVSDTNQVYDINNVNDYIDNPETKTITMLVDTGELHKWTLSITSNSTEQPEFKFINKPSPALYINKSCIVKNGRYYYVQIETTTANTKLKSGQCTIVLKHGDEQIDIITDTINLNETVYVRFEPPINAFSNKTYDVMVTVETERMIAKDQFELKLTSSVPTISENN